MPIRRLGLMAAVMAPAICAVAGAGGPEGYRDHEAVVAEARALAAGHDRCAFGTIGTSLEGREIVLLTLGSESPRTPALLITAGLDGRHLVGTETALRVARRLLEEHADVLDEITVYVVPRVNPDGAERCFADPVTPHAGNRRPTDEDHDGAVDEDPPLDLDGDGFVTQMRRLDPPLDDHATHLADPAEPRLLKTADPAKGERAVYSLYTEGLDLDGDGAYAEDGIGAVDLDRNFMHEWPEYETDAGAYQLSEPESLALAELVLAHPEIVAAITYGRHDNLVNVPDGKGKDVSGRGPKDLDPDDVAVYKEIGERFRELTGQERAPKEDAAGSFHAWLYAQRGIPSFATVVWGRPDPSPPPEPEAPEGPAAEPAREGAAGAPPEPHDQMGEPDETDDEPPGARRGGRAAQRGGEASPPSEDEEATGEPDEEDQEAPAARERGRREKPEKEDKKPKPANEEDAAWLAYSDRDRGGAGFIEWRPFEHPTLGAVEIGGFVPGFRMNPPAETLDDLAEKQTAFALDLIDRRPRLTVEGPEVKALAPGLYEIRLGLVNDGYLPTTTAQARKARSILPTVVRLSPPLERIVAGERVTRIWGIAGSGARETRRWLVRAEPGETIEIGIRNQQLGDMIVNVVAPE